MKDILSHTWLYESPFDYELKLYSLLGAVSLYRVEINKCNIEETLYSIENHLKELYKIKYSIEGIDLSTRVIVGIDIDTMSLDYQYVPHDDIDNERYDLCERGIEEFENLHSILRKKWRTIKESIAITEIPSVREGIRFGYFFIIDSNNKMYVYSFNIKSGIKINQFNPKLVSTFEYSNSKLVELSQEFDKKIETRFFRFDIKKAMPFDTCAYPIIRYMIYSKISKNN